MKVCAVSPWATASARDILSFLKGATAEIVVLPGVCLNTPSPQEVQRALARGVHVFVEHGGAKAKAIPYLVTCDGAEPMPPGVFAQSPTAKLMEQLAAVWPCRTSCVGSREVTFAICGEINAFNPDGSTKHGQELKFDILANPAHTIMGRWQHLGPKLRALSNGRVVIHVANNNRNHGHLTTDLRIYINEILQEDKLQNDGKLKWCECELPTNVRPGDI
jgi:hypothetical protein